MGCGHNAIIIQYAVLSMILH